MHSSINNRRRPIPKNGPVRLDRCRCLVDDVFEHGVGGVELRYPGRELYHVPYISIIRRWMEEDMTKTHLRRTGTRIRNKTAIGAYRFTG